jgi:hypothetical protein
VGSVLAGLGDEAGCATALRHQAHMARDLGRAEEGLRLALSALELAVRADDRSTVAACRRMVVQCLAHGPTPIDAAVAAARGELAGLRLDGAETAGVPCALGLLVAQAGHVADARGLVEQDLAAVRGASGAWQTVGCLILAGLMERAAGCLDDAEGHFETVYEMLSVANERSVLPAVAGQLACLAARRGDMVRAAALADECRAGSADGDFVSDALWRRARALVAATEARRDEVERLAVDVASVLEATDWLTFVGESFEDLAEAWAAMGDEPARRRALESALRAYEQRGSRSGVERTRTLPVLE